MGEAPDDLAALPPHLVMLRRLVTVLTVVMIAGFVVLIYALVTRLNAPAPVLPDQITLPGGATATAFTQGVNWYAVVTSDNRILIFDRTTGALRQTIEVK